MEEVALEEAAEAESVVVMVGDSVQVSEEDPVVVWEGAEAEGAAEAADWEEDTVVDLVQEVVELV